MGFPWEGLPGRHAVPDVVGLHQPPPNDPARVLLALGGGLG